jgi:hypothetical protein
MRIGIISLCLRIDLRNSSMVQYDLLTLRS